MVLRLRELTAEERSAVDQLAHARTAPARRVERARIIRRASRGAGAPEIAATLGLDAATVRGWWIRRFNAEGASPGWTIAPARGARRPTRPNKGRR